MLKIVKKFANYCKLKIYQIYINVKAHDSSLLNVKIRGSKAIGIDNNTFSSAITTNNYKDINFTICCRLADIYLGHYNVWLQALTFWAKIVPIFKQAYKRVQSYSTDNVVQIIIGDREMICCVFREYFHIYSLSDDEIINIIYSKKKTKYNKFRYISLIEDMLAQQYPLPYNRFKNILKNIEKNAAILGKKVE